MNERFIDALSRRASLVTLGAAGTSTLASPVAAGSRKNKKAKKKCKKQTGQCNAFLNAECEGDPECIASRGGRCCPFLGTCDVSGFFACVLAGTNG